MPRLHSDLRTSTSLSRGAAVFAVLFISFHLHCDGQSTLKEKPVTLAVSEPQSSQEQLPSIAKDTLKKHFGLIASNLSLTEFAKTFAVPPQFNRRAGLFVTLSKDGKTRACWGSLDARFDNLVQATVFTTEQALTDEYRFNKIKTAEIDTLHPQITVVKKVEPLHDIREQNPARCGLLVRSGGKSGIILAGEASDPYYQLVQCKLKAGIKKNEAFQMYRIKADVYR
ncbi:MAG TPA: AMMECR1 domain-containing protein [Oculatellaceae cyanobacterium]